MGVVTSSPVEMTFQTCTAIRMYWKFDQLNNGTSYNCGNKLPNRVPQALEPAERIY